MDDFERTQELKRRAEHALRHNPTPTMLSQWTYFDQEARNTMRSAKDRRLFRQLADELEPRLPRDPRKPTKDDVPLW